MIAYVDSSVVLRVLLGQPHRLPEWNDIVTGVASRLLEVECLRTLDRLQHLGHLRAEAVAERREAVFRVLEALELVEVTPSLLHRAGQPMPTPLGSLDAIHLASAELWRETNAKELVFATHDRALAVAARASGIRTVGV